MKYDIIWSKTSLANLRTIHQFLRKKSLNTANKATVIIERSTKKLQSFPLIGKPVETLKNYYDIPIPFASYGYRMRYKVQNRTVYIVYIKHFRELDDNP